ncbi:YfhL family 4Fe-4S dicluster ferredoxin, partial [Acinetobacter baumannii]|nr:(4Fe-4S)-binding protein [Acinetobacter baumannii]
YEIDPLRCTECVGFYDAPTCKVVCPIDCIKQDPVHIENKEQLLEKFKDLNLIGSFSF